MTLTLSSPSSSVPVTVFIITAYLKAADRLDQAIQEEGKRLIEAIEGEIIGAREVIIREIRPSTYIGSGVIEELKGVFEAIQPTTILFNGQLSPLQQRNLEKAWKRPVIDRTRLILEIFSKRAQSAAGRLQVELAHLTYQKSRLVRSWTHLERQRGGLGFIGGGGERQIEVDRRLIDQKIQQLKTKIGILKRTRSLQRQARQRVPFPMMALVGYTNAGKSTLFNRLTDSHVFAKDLLFATLDPTVRHMRLPGHQSIMLSDTVGFISALPTELIAAFEATLEGIREAELILHVRDIADVNTQKQAEEVYHILKKIGVTQTDHIFEVHNKIDQLQETVDDMSGIHEIISPFPTFPISALTGQGIDKLIDGISQFLNRPLTIVTLVIPYEEGKALAVIHGLARILNQSDAEEGHVLTIEISPPKLARFQKSFPDIHVHSAKES